MWMGYIIIDGDVMTQKSHKIRYKIVESVPDKDGFIIIAIKPDEYGLFKSRDEALDAIHALYSSRPATSAEKVLDIKRFFLGKIAQRIRHEFTQDGDNEYYLCAEDFENILDELEQELEDEIKDEPRQQEKK
jgi:hypothetical protein